MPVRLIADVDIYTVYGDYILFWFHGFSLGKKKELRLSTSLTNLDLHDSEWI